MTRYDAARTAVAEKTRGHESRRDHFPRLVVRIGPRPRDTVILQPALLQRLDKNPETLSGESRTEG
ncbi:MAG TPA: hypothetical protein VLH79_07150 [Chthonomonadales bacterium]|nr:hypothetical protein [Chthonomonadales bacterium]